ncbi:MAG: V-type ATPase subunit [Actinomycetota bacterium]|nr:V-type ATPase subunit [Actinomycetota bacterium]
MLRRIRPYSQPLKYGYASGRIKVMERTLLQKQQVDRLINADFEECKRILMETDYGPFLADARVARKVEEGLQDYLAGTYAFFKDPTVPGWLEDFFLSRYDLHNLRVLFKERFFEREEPDALLPFSRVDPDLMRAAVRNSNWNELPAWMAGVAAKLAGRMELEPDPQLVDVILDRFFLEHRLEIVGKVRSTLVRDFCRMTIDLANIKVLLRCERMGKPASFAAEAMADGGTIDRGVLLQALGKGMETMIKSVGDRRYVELLVENIDLADKKVRLTHFDRAADDFVLDFLRQARRVAAGPDTVIGFIYAKENEVMLLRIILMGKLHALTPERIDNQLRGVYTQ